jgi:hypothetical protein
VKNHYGVVVKLVEVVVVVELVVGAVWLINHPLNVDGVVVVVAVVEVVLTVDVGATEIGEIEAGITVELVVKLVAIGSTATG